MTSTMKQPHDPRVVLSYLWIFATLNYLYCDVLGLMDSRLLNQYITGTVNGLEMTPAFLLSGAVLMQIPIVMVLIARFARYHFNRWANIAAGLIKTITMILTMFVGIPTMYYLFFGTIEILTTAFIVWYAWKWKLHIEPEIQ